MHKITTVACALAVLATTSYGQAVRAADAPKAGAGMSCAQIRAIQHDLNQEEQTIRLRIQAQRKGEGENVRNVREMIKLLPGVYAGAKGEQLLAEARKMDEADAFANADQVKSGQTASADQKQILALQARSLELDKAYAANPDCEDRGEFSHVRGRR